MKNTITIREKVLLCILGILSVILVYYYLFYIPMKKETKLYRQEYVTVDETLLEVEARAAQMMEMKAEIEAIKAGNAENTRELPKYDNRQNLMSQLSGILAKTNNYSISFGAITGDGTTISRQITLNYTCDSYQSAKAILKEIYNGEYPCSFGNMNLSGEGRSVSMYITYYEYGELE